MGANEDPISVFLSYAGPERDQAKLVQAELSRRGLEVWMDDSFEPGTSIIVNVGSFIERASIVVGIISEAYLDRHFTEIEVSAVMANPESRFLPVVIGGEPVPRTSRGVGLWTVLRGRSYFRLTGDESSYDELAAAVTAKVTEMGTGRGRYVTTVSRSNVTTEIDPGMVIAYDWEDNYLLNIVENAFVGLGAASPHFASAATLQAERAIPRNLAILWTNAALTSTEMSRVVLEAVAQRVRVTYLQVSEGPPPPINSRVLVLPPHPNASTRTFDHSTTRRARLALLAAKKAEALDMNDQIPFHIIGDKFCARRQSYAAAHEAYRLAVTEIPAMADGRLESVLAYAAASRFTGDWLTARDALTAEPLAETRSPTDTSLALEADLISLEFELGRIPGIIGRASTLLAKSLSASQWPAIIYMHRLLGMIHEQQGGYTSARDHLSRAFNYCEDLLDTPQLEKTIPIRDARLAMTADCLRELAALEWRAGGARVANSQLAEADGICQSINTVRLNEYMRALIKQQAARVQYSLNRDYEQARSSLNEVYTLFQTYDNPIRTATVLESLVRLEMNFLRQSDDRVNTLRPVLEKVKRIREMRHHDYMIARTSEVLGDLDYALGNWSSAAEKYEDARRDFNRLGKQPEAASTARSLSRCYSRMGEPDNAIEVLESALENLRDSDQRRARADIRSEMVRLLHRHLGPGEVDEATEMTGVGEFSVHHWIANELLAQGSNLENVLVGAGDDCAILRLESTVDLAITTDSTPPALLNTQSPEAAEYASRFAIVSSLSDVLAMGGEPMAMLLNLHLRRDTPATWARALLQSAEKEAQRFGAQIVGGDLKERENPGLTTVAVGKVQRGRILRRCNARPGQLLVMTLSGGSDGIFHGLGRMWAQDLTPYLSERERATIASLAEQNAAYNDLGLPINVMRDVMQRDIARAAIDTSDGVLACAQLIGEESDVGIELDLNALDVIISSDVRNLAQALDIAPFLFALNAGHDWEIIFSCPRDKREEVEEIAKREGSRYPRLAIIGKVVDRASWADKGVRLLFNNTSVLLPYFTDEKFVTSPYEGRPRDWLEFAREVTRLVRSHG
jgi:thiamine-monophosphate kinase